MNRRRDFFAACDADRLHQHVAGLASWAAFSARWRARQGLPLLDAMDVQYLTPDDFRTGLGRPLVPAEQRRRFRAYVQAAIASAARIQARIVMQRRGGLLSGDLAFVRCAGFHRRFERSHDFLFGRPDLPPYDDENLSPTRPYGIPVTSETFEAYWLSPDVDVEEEW